MCDLLPCSFAENNQEKPLILWCLYRIVVILHPKQRVERFGQLATTVKNAKWTTLRVVCTVFLAFPISYFPVIFYGFYGDLAPIVPIVSIVPIVNIKKK